VGPLVTARNTGRVGDFLVRRYSGGTAFRSQDDVKQVLAETGVRSDPPPGGHPVLNLYVQDGDLVVEWDDA